MELHARRQGSSSRARRASGDAVTNESDPEWDTQRLNNRFVRHCSKAYDSDATARRWARAMARGLYVILRDRALAGDMQAAMGAPHFLLYEED